ncbi:MAG: galactokinase, partial [Planctomycetes bacterium]|nr:galactokinase [Planctomycetota bacterium]
MPSRPTQTTERFQRLTAEFAKSFGDARGLIIVRAPGRVNLIGEHTDYNGGFVLPIAIDRDIAIACRPNGTRRVDLCSMDFNDRASFSLDALARDEQHKWVNYVQGVAQFLQEAGARLAGFDGVIQGNVPIGSGVSSSAAMEVASAMAWTHLLGLTFDKKALALLCQKAENKFVGVNCGIMDQFVSVFGAAGHAVLIDCRSLQHELVPFDASRAVVLVCNTGVKRELATSAYNERRAQCEEAVRRLS